MPDLSRDERRLNRKHVLTSLSDETGSFGGGAATERVKAYCKNPIDATTQDFGFVGGLALSRFFIAPSKPNQAERRSLWQRIVEQMNKEDTADPGGWDRDTLVMQLQAIAEEAE